MYIEVSGLAAAVVVGGHNSNFLQIFETVCPERLLVILE